MTEEQKQEFKEYIHQAIQAGKQETSGLVGDLVSKIDKSISVSIEKNVNGKINKLTDKLDDYVKSSLVWREGVDDYIKQDNEWKQTAEPYIKGLANITGSSKIIVFIVGAIGTIIGAWLALKELLK